MSELVRIITSSDPAVRNQSVDEFCRTAASRALLSESAALDAFWRFSPNLYERVRAQFFLYAIHRFHLPFRPDVSAHGQVPFAASTHILNRRFEQAIEVLLGLQSATGPDASLSSAFAAAYRGLAFKTLAGQVRRSVRSVRGNQWMSRTGHPEDYPLVVRPELLRRESDQAPYPVLKESTPVRMDLTHSAWSDIFFLGMDFPEGARVLNISVDLSVRGQGSEKPAPPVEAYFRVIDEPLLRLTSVDLGATADITTFAELFDFGRDYLGLLKAGVIASGLVPPAMEGALQPLSALLIQLVGEGRGIEIVSRVRDIPKGSRLAVSTNLLACLISVCMRATQQASNLTGPLADSERRIVAARAILGEWLGGSGGGWQDSGGVWPGIKLIEGAIAGAGDPEFGISRGRLLPSHNVLSTEQVSLKAREALQNSLVLVHGGMAQDVGPVLEMVTERYLLRSEPEWKARLEAIGILDEVLASLRAGDVARLGAVTERNYFGPIQTIIPWASNIYAETLIHRTRESMGPEFWGFWMLGGMAGGGMGFMFHPRAKEQAQDRLLRLMRDAKAELEDRLPFAMEPVVYDFAINERGTVAELKTGQDALLPESYYTLLVPSVLRMDPRLIPASRRAELNRFSSACRTSPRYSSSIQNLFDRLLPSAAPQAKRGSSNLGELLAANGFDLVQHEQIRADLINGRIGLAQNRLPATTHIEDCLPSDVFDATREVELRLRELGEQALRSGEVAAVSLAGGVGTRWTRGAGVVKALTPFCKMSGKYRSFVDVHLAKTLRTRQLFEASIPHVVTSSYLTHAPIESALRGLEHVYVSPGQSVGLRMVPTARDLRFAWEELSQQTLDEQKQKVRDSSRAALIQWAQTIGEGSDYTSNLPQQCLHPTGHWYEIPNMLRNGVLRELLNRTPQLRYLMIHNIDTVGANLDPGILGFHIHRQAALTFEVITRHFDDRGGGLARVNSRPRLVEGMALPSENIEATLSYYNSNTCWVDIDKLLAVFSLTRIDLGDDAKVSEAIRRVAARMPTYVTLKDVKERWGNGQEDVFPVAQFEKLFVDMTALPEVGSAYVAVPRPRGSQLKEPAQLDGWLRDGSAAYVETLTAWD
jgi:UTP--glucose-1-phosphate uridylyltransferase